MRLRDQLLLVSEAFAEALGKAEASVSTRVFGSGDSISRLRNGADMRSERIHDGLQWFSDNWPTDATWPIEVPRPDRTPEPAPADEVAA